MDFENSLSCSNWIKFKLDNLYHVYFKRKISLDNFEPYDFVSFADVQT